MTSLLLLVRFFPYDPSIDVPLERIHLPLIYCLTWGVHLIYVAYIAARWKSLKKKKTA
jgi:hypothetical protein